MVCNDAFRTNNEVMIYHFDVIACTRNRVHNRHVFANPPECHILASYKMWFAKNCSQNSRKSQKSPIFDRKCSYLVMLRSGNSARNRKSPISGSGQSYQNPLSICTFCSKKWRFLAFSRKNLSNSHKNIW